MTAANQELLAVFRKVVAHIPQPMREAATTDVRNAIQSNVPGGPLPAAAALAIVTAVSASAIADMLHEIGVSFPADHANGFDGRTAAVSQLFAEELRGALARAKLL